MAIYNIIASITTHEISQAGIVDAPLFQYNHHQVDFVGFMWMNTVNFGNNIFEGIDALPILIN